MAEDHAPGELDQTKGVITETVGKGSGDRWTEVSGKVEKKIGEAKDAISEKDRGE